MKLPRWMWTAALTPLLFSAPAMTQEVPNLASIWDSVWTPRNSEGIQDAPVALTAEGRALMAEFDPRDDPAVRCEHPGLVRQVITPYPIRIDQEDDRVTINYEEWSVVRPIPLGDEPLASEPGPMGQSVGRFEGGMLIVETMGLTRGLAMIPQFFWTSEQATVVERYYLGDDGMLQQDMIVTDPVMLGEPWVTHQTYRPYDVDVLPFECELRERTRRKSSTIVH